MDASKVIAVSVGLVGLIGAGAAFDARYWHADAAEQTVKEIRVDIEKIRLENSLTTQRARLSFLANKSKPTADDKLEQDWLRTQVSLLQQQLSALQK